ncbi:MAG: hypothetical protein WB822_19890 [Rhodoplanes sp.]
MSSSRWWVLVGLRTIGCAPVEPPETEVAVGGERAQLVFLGQRQRFTVLSSEFEVVHIPSAAT